MGISEEEGEENSKRIATCLLLVILLFSWPKLLLLSQEKLKHSLGCVIVVCVCVCMHVCDRVHKPMWKKPVPVFAECRQTDEGKTERHISFIGSLGVLLFCFGGLAVIHHDLTCTAICQP